MKIGFFITARLKSSRLKNKILLDLNGKPVLQRVIERCKSISGIDGVVLCTSTNYQDSTLYRFALNNNIEFYPGSEEDVLERLLDAAEYYKYDYILSITADNPAFSTYSTQYIVDLFRDLAPDFVFTKNLPIGCSVYGLNAKALKIVNYMKKNSNTEIWGAFVNRPDFFNILELSISNSRFNENKRLTIDYFEDYLLLSKLFNLYPTETNPSLEEIFNVMELNPEYWEINKNRTQTYPNKNTISSINKNFNSRKKAGIKFAEKINHALYPQLQKINI